MQCYDACRYACFDSIVCRVWGVLCCDVWCVLVICMAHVSYMRGVRVVSECVCIALYLCCVCACV